MSYNGRTVLQPDTSLGRYRLIARLGAGGMGEVWKAEDTQLGRTVAVKILPPNVASDAEAVARMRREARTAAQLYHPNIATIHAIEEVDGRLFIVMEYVEGEPLASMIRRGGISEADVCRIGRQVADALAEAHAKGIAHRDIKPDNIVVSGARVKVLDFGIAKQLAGFAKSDDPTAVLTHAGMIVGTVLYMSPEQALGKELDPRTDLFSLGVVLYEMATGRLPFRGDTITETITKIVRDEPERPMGVSPELAEIIRRCLEKDRERRFSRAEDLAGALERQQAIAPTAPYTRQSPARGSTTVLTGSQLKTVAKSTSPARWPWVAGVVLLVLAAAIGGFVIAKNQKPAEPAPVRTTTTAVPEPVPGPAPQAVPATQVVTVTESAAPPPPPPPVETAAPAKSADDHYRDAMAALAERRVASARQSFSAALAADPHHAKAHFRLGQIALVERDMESARHMLRAALADADRLEPRERLLAELALAIANGERERARELGRQVREMSPRDPDLAVFLREFGEEPPPQRQRPPFGRRRP